MTSPEDFEVLNKIRVMRQLKKKLNNTEDYEKRKKLKKKIENLNKEIKEYTLDSG